MRVGHDEQPFQSSNKFSQLNLPPLVFVRSSRPSAGQLGFQQTAHNMTTALFPTSSASKAHELSDEGRDTRYRLMFRIAALIIATGEQGVIMSAAIGCKHAACPHTVQECRCLSAATQTQRPSTCEHRARPCARARAQMRARAPTRTLAHALVYARAYTQRLHGGMPVRMRARTRPLSHLSCARQGHCIAADVVRHRATLVNNHTRTTTTYYYYYDDAND